MYIYTYFIHVHVHTHIYMHIYIFIWYMYMYIYIYIYILYMYMYTFIFIFILCVYTSNCRYQHRSQVRDNILIETLGTRGSQKPTTLTDWQRQGNQLLALWDLFLTGCRGTKILLRPSSLWTDSRYIFNIFFGFQQFSPNFFRLHPSIFFLGDSTKKQSKDPIDTQLVAFFVGPWRTAVMKIRVSYTPIGAEKQLTDPSFSADHRPWRIRPKTLFFPQCFSPQCFFPQSKFWGTRARLVTTAEFIRVNGQSPLTTIRGFTPWRCSVFWNAATFELVAHMVSFPNVLHKQGLKYVGPKHASVSRNLSRLAAYIRSGNLHWPLCIFFHALDRRSEHLWREIAGRAAFEDLGPVFAMVRQQQNLAWITIVVTLFFPSFCVFQKKYQYQSQIMQESHMGAVRVRLSFRKTHCKRRLVHIQVLDKKNSMERQAAFWYSLRWSYLERFTKTVHQMSTGQVPFFKKNTYCKYPQNNP